MSGRWSADMARRSRLAPRRESRMMQPLLELGSA
jgi:hypothetical protein